MLKKVFKALVGISVLSVVIISGNIFAEASSKEGNIIVDDKTEMSAEEYFDTWETISEDELPEGLIPLEFESEEEAYSYLKENDEKWLTSGDEIFVVAFEEVSEEVFNKTLEENYYGDITLLSDKSKLVASETVVPTGSKGRVGLIVDYSVGRENGKNIITSADERMFEQDIPNDYNVHVDSTECIINKDKKRATAKATGMVERVVKINDHFRVQKRKLKLSGSVRAQYISFQLKDIQKL